MNDPIVEAHIARAGANEALARDLINKIPQTDWRIVVHFYAAMHLVQAYLITKDARFHAKRHDERWKAIKASPELKNHFRKHFKMLQDVSEQVRYDPGFNGSHCLPQSAGWLLTVRNVLAAKLTRRGYVV